MPTTNPTQTIRGPNGLVETKIQGNTLAGGTAPAVTPAGASVQGANPDQAKMAGTPAQKAPVLTQAVTPDQTVEGQARYTAAPAAAVSSPQADRLQQLGSYGPRIQALLQDRLNQVQAQATGLSVNQGAVSALLAGKSPAEVAAATAALAQYAKGGRSEADLAALTTQIGLPQLGAGQLASLYTGAPEALAGLGQAATGAVTLSQLDLAKSGIDPAQLAQDLGVASDALLAMTPDQLQSAVQDVAARQYNESDTLRAEMATASPQRQAEIAAELRARGESGASATDAAVQSLGAKLESQEQVQFNGKSYNIQDLLKDQTVSNTIQQAATNAAALTQLEASNPGLAAWIRQNQASLKALSDDMGAQVGALQQTQNQYQSLVGSVGSVLAGAFGLTTDGTVTSAKLAELQQKLQATPLYIAMQANPEVDALVRSAKDPAALARQVAAMSPDQIAQSVAFTNSVAGDPTLTQLLGLDPGAQLVVPTNLQVQARDQWNALPGDAKSALTPALKLGIVDPDVVGAYAMAPQLLTNPTMQALLGAGTVDTKEELLHIAKDPGILDRIKASDDERTYLDRVAAPDSNHGDLMLALFGNPQANPGVLLPEALASLQRDVEIYKKYDPSKVAGAEQQLRQWTADFDANGDGRADAADFTDDGLRQIAARLGKTASANDILAGASSALSRPAWMADGAAAFARGQQAYDARTRASSMAEGMRRAMTQTAAENKPNDQIAASGIKAKLAAPPPPPPPPAPPPPSTKLVQVLVPTPGTGVGQIQSVPEDSPLVRKYGLYDPSKSTAVPGAPGVAFSWGS